MAVPPTIKAFLTADALIQDRAGKWSVIGIFDQVFAAGFPCVHPVVAIYVKMTDARGHYKVRIEFRDSTDRILAKFEGVEFTAGDATRGVEFGLTAPYLRLEKPGRYEFQLYLNDEYVAATTLSAVQVQAPPGALPPQAPPPA